MAREFGAVQYTGKAPQSHDDRRYAQPQGTQMHYPNHDIGNSVEEEAGIDSDDPTNTAMFLDESEESELERIMPGTPQAFKQLGQLTVKSITRQRVSQTPVRPPNGTSSNSQHTQSSKSRNSRYDNTESPSKKGKGHASSLQTAIPMLTPMPAPAARAEAVRTKGANDMSVPMSVRRIQSSRRASRILNKIKQASPEAKPRTDGPLVDVGTAGRNSRISLGPNFNKNEFSPFLFSKLTKLRENRTSDQSAGEQPPPPPPLLQMNVGQSDDVCKTPESKARRYGPSTPYNMLRALSEKSSESGSTSRYPSGSAKPNELGSGNSEALGADPFMSTPAKQKHDPPSGAAEKSEHRQRIESLRKFFDKHLGELMPSETEDHAKATPAPTRNHGELLISFDTADQQRGDAGVPYTSRISQMSSIRQSDGVDEPPLSPSPLRPTRMLGANTNGVEHDVASDSASSLLLSFTSRQDHDTSKPIPFLLNQIEQQQQDTQWTGDRSNLIDLSSRLNTSINALNRGLREHLTRTTAATNGDLGTAQTTNAHIAEPAATSSVRPVATTAASDGRLIDTSIRADSSLQSELEGQVDTLRKTMEETKAIVFSIQTELGQQRQGHATEDTKLDDIARLLGALDMRLHMLEDRQRLDQSGSGSAAGSPMARRTNAGSTKIHPNHTQSQNLLARLGQLIVHCLSQYPLMIIGALFIILVSELMVISGVRLDAQKLNVYGKYALDELKRHMNMPHPPS